MKETSTRSKHQTKYHLFLLFLSGSCINWNVSPSLLTLWEKLKISKEITKSRKTKDRQHINWKKTDKTSLPLWSRFFFVSCAERWPVLPCSCVVFSELTKHKRWMLILTWTKDRCFATFRSFVICIVRVFIDSLIY